MVTLLLSGTVVSLAKIVKVSHVQANEIVESFRDEITAFHKSVEGRLVSIHTLVNTIGEKIILHSIFESSFDLL